MSVLAVRGIRKAFGGVKAVAGIDFDVAAGEVVAMIGPNGAGKTTCFNMLGGQLRPDAGSIRFNGREIAGRPPHVVWRLGIGRTFQVAATFSSMTARENVQMVLLSHRRHLLRLWRPARRILVSEAEALLALVGLGAEWDRAAGVLAYADLKRLELAMALANRPQLLLLDEPTAGVALGERQALVEVVAKIVRERGISVLFTEHDMDVVFGFAARVIVLHHGSVAAAGTPEEVRADPTVREIYLGAGLEGVR